MSIALQVHIIEYSCNSHYKTWKEGQIMILMTTREVSISAYISMHDCVVVPLFGYTALFFE